MTTATKDTPTTAKPDTKAVAFPPQAPAKILYQGYVAIEKIIIGGNIRKKFNPVKLAELTESVRHHGVDTPILLRPADKAGFYFLVAGARRIKASIAVGLKEIPAIVKDLTEQQARESQAIENIQREDLDPIDEARGFKILIDLGKYTVEQLAQRIDKSLPYVYRSIKLLELPKEIIEAIEEGKLTPAHGAQLLRVPDADRAKVLKEWNEMHGEPEEYQTAKDLTEWIDDRIGQDLSGAKFPKDKPYAGQVACAACPSNSGNQNVLFDGAVKGTCTFKACFDTKIVQHKKDLVEKVTLKYLSAKFVEFTKGGYVYPGNRRAGGWLARGPLEKEPKVPYGILIDSSEKLHYATMEKETAEESSGGSSRPQQYDWEKDNFVRAAVRDALYAAEAREAVKLKGSRKLYEEAAFSLLNNNGGDRFAEALGVKKIQINKLTDDQLAAAIVYCTRESGWHPKKKEIEAEAKKKALADYKAKVDAAKAEAIKKNNAAAEAKKK